MPCSWSAADLRRDQASDRLRVFAERAGIDDRVGRIVVDIGDRRKRQVDADRAAFERRDAAELVGIRVAPGGAHAHIGGKRRSAVQSNGGAGFEVRGHQQGQVGALLQPVELGRHVERGADRDDQAADVE